MISGLGNKYQPVSTPKLKSCNYQTFHITPLLSATGQIPPGNFRHRFLKNNYGSNPKESSSSPGAAFFIFKKQHVRFNATRYFL